MATENRVEIIHKMLRDAGYDALYGVTVPDKGWRVEGYNGPDRNLVVEYRWHGENVTISVFHEYGVPVEWDKLAEWLKA